MNWKTSPSEFNPLNDIPKSFWELESIGISDAQCCKEPLLFIEGVSFVQGQYEVA